MTIYPVPKPPKKTRVRGGCRLTTRTPSKAAVPKPFRIKDRDYMKFVRTLPCAVCLHLGEKQTTRTEAHHTTTRSTFGGDDTCAPTCQRHHKAWHLMGPKSFKQRFKVDLAKVAKQLWAAFKSKGWAA